MSKKLEDAFNALGNTTTHTFVATIVSVNKEKSTCVINDDDLQYENVKLTAKTDESNSKWVLFPKVGSTVLVSAIENDLHHLYVHFFSEIESIELTIDETKLQIDNNGFLLKKENETLKKLMVDLLKEIQKMKFTTNTGSTILLVNKPQFIQIENRFKQFLKDS